MTLEQENERLKAALIEATLRSAAAAEGVAAGVVDDLALYSQHFTVASDGKTITHRDSGAAPADWLKSMRNDKPHWFPQMKASGETFTSNPWSADNWNKTEQGKIYSQDVKMAEAMAKAAGVDVMAAHPKKGG